MESLSIRGARARGASTVELALLSLILVVVCAAGFRGVGRTVARATAASAAALDEPAGRETRVVHIPSGPGPAARP